MKTTRSIADRLLALADSMQKEIDHGRRPMTQNPTPKRMREYNSRMHDANNAERTQRALRALAAGHQAGNLPPILADLRMRPEVFQLMRKSLKHAGYYDVFEDDAYANTSPAAIALQQLVDGTTTATDQAADEARHKAEKIRRLEDQLRFADIPGFFPTPAATIEMMLDRAQIAPGNTVLEPSAGTGSIADAIKARVPSLPDGPGVLVMCCERMTRLREILREKGHTLTEVDDFMEMPAAGEFDRVLMNPPFEKQQDIDHVRRAFDHVKPGGRLVAIVGAGAFSRGNRKATEFREWLDQHGATVEDLNGAFSTPDAFRRTTVAARLVTIEKQPADTPPAPVTTPKSRPMAHKSRRQAPEEAAESTIPPAESPSNATPSVPMAQPSRGGMSLVAKYRPATLSAIIGQKPVVDALRAFSRAPAPAAFIFAGTPG